MIIFAIYKIGFPSTHPDRPGLGLGLKGYNRIIFRLRQDYADFDL
jgi:hypothetical protein